MPALPLLDDTFLRSQWAVDFDAFESSSKSAALLARLRAWASRDGLNERASETAFIQRFFVETWGYRLQGGETGAYNCRPQFEVIGAGQSGGSGLKGAEKLSSIRPARKKDSVPSLTTVW